MSQLCSADAAPLLSSRTSIKLSEANRPIIIQIPWWWYFDHMPTFGRAKPSQNSRQRRGYSDQCLIPTIYSKLSELVETVVGFQPLADVVLVLLTRLHQLHLKEET